MSISEDLIFDERGFLFDPSTGFTYALNSTGAFIFDRLRQGEDTADIIETLMEQFHVDSKTANEDHRDFLQLLNDYKLVKEYAPV